MTKNNRSFGFVFIGRFSLSDWENKSAFADAASKHGDARRMWSSVLCVRRSSLLTPNYESRQRQASDWQCSARVRRKTAPSPSQLRLIHLSLSEKYIHFRWLAHKWGETWWITLFTADWHGQRSVLSQLCVSSTTLGDTQRMLGLLGAAPGVVTYFRRKHRWVCVAQRSQVDRCHLDDESPNSGWNRS